MNIQSIKKKLEASGVVFAPGLSDAELQRAEREYHFCFPPDLREFLMAALPVSKGFPNWRAGPKKAIIERLEWPYDGICFDVGNSAFWIDPWGKRPASDEDACRIVRHAVDSAPRLIPVYGHRYIADRPCESDNPVLSVYQTDIIYYGRNLFDYLENEFVRTPEKRDRSLKSSYKTTKHLEFWSDIVEKWSSSSIRGGL